MVTTSTSTVLNRRAVGLFYSRDEAEKAIKAIKNAGFDTNKISLFAKDADKVEGIQKETTETGNEAPEGAGIGATTGAVLGGIAGLLVGIGTLALPGVGAIVVAGEASAIASTLAGAGIGAASGALIGALTGLGIPEEQAKIYSDRVTGGSYLLIYTGTPAEISRVEPILQDNGIEEYNAYDAPPLA
ncbi:MAG: general stress protein [Microcoleaceae cyanobacterium]